MTVKAVVMTAGKCTVSIPEFSVSADDPKRAARYAETMNGFYIRLRDGILSSASARNGQGTLHVRGIEGSFEAEQTGAAGFRIKYVIRGRFLAPGPTGVTAIRRSRVIGTEWDNGVVSSFTML